MAYGRKGQSQLASVYYTVAPENLGHQNHSSITKCGKENRNVNHRICGKTENLRPLVPFCMT
mgnify:CR=1 FL=1